MQTTRYTCCDIDGDAKISIGEEKSRHRSSHVAYACRALHTATHARSHTRARPSCSGTAMRDLVPLRRRSTFELGLPRSQLSPLRRRMSIEGQRECTTRRWGGRDHLSRGCIHRACLTRVYPSAGTMRRATNALECATLPLRVPAKHVRGSRSRSCRLRSQMFLVMMNYSRT